MFDFLALTCTHGNLMQYNVQKASWSVTQGFVVLIVADCHLASHRPAEGNVTHFIVISNVFVIYGCLLIFELVIS